MPTINVLDGTGASQTVNTLPAVGSNTAANSLPVTLATDSPSLGTPGMPVPGEGQLMLGSDGTNARAISTSSSGVLNVNATGNVLSGSTDSGAPVKTGGVASTAVPTAVAAGQRTNTWTGLNGQTMVSFGFGAGVVINFAQGVQVPFDAQGVGRLLGVANSIFNGSNFDINRKPNITSRLSATAAGGSPTVAKASAGDVWNIYGAVGAVGTWLQIYNKATTPVLGTDTPVLSIPMTASTFFKDSLNGLYLNAGVAYAFTTDAAGTTAAAASAVTGFGLTAA